MSPVIPLKGSPNFILRIMYERILLEFCSFAGELRFWDDVWANPTVGDTACRYESIVVSGVEIRRV